MSLPIALIISGGQTGVDQVGLHVAKALGYPTGGTAPKGWRTDAGPAPWLADYGLVENFSRDYTPRTIANARRADLTVWFGEVKSPGARVTLRAAAVSMCLQNPDAATLRAQVEELAAFHGRPLILNVAGNRLRTNPKATAKADSVLREALQ